jgi:hypothetical protein
VFVPDDLAKLTEAVGVNLGEQSGVGVHVGSMLVAKSEKARQHFFKIYSHPDF